MADGAYTVEQYREAARKAREAGNIQAAEELARAGMAAMSATPPDETTPTALPATPPPAAPERLIDDSVTDAEPESLAQRSARRAGQELLATPGAVGAMWGLANAAIDRYKNGVPWDEAMLSEEGRDLIERARAGDQEALTQIQEDPTSILRTGLQSAAEWYNWGGEVTGVTNNPDGSVPLDEEVGGILGSTLLTLPAAIVTKPLAIANKISNVGVRTAVKGAIRAAELTTPGTIGAGKYGSNIAANAAVQVAMNDVVRGIMDEQTLAGTALAEITDEEVDEALAGAPISDDEDVGKTALAVGGAGALAAALGGGRAIARSATQIGDTVTSDAARLGAMPVRDSAGNALGDLAQNVQTAVIDESNVLLEGMRRTGVSRERMERFDDFMRAEAGSASNAARNRFVETGILDADGSIRTEVPYIELDRMYQRMDETMRTKVDNYIMALDEQARRRRGIRNVPHLSDTDLTRIVSANGTPEVKRFADLYFDQGQKLSEYRYKHDIIDAGQYAAESSTYMPNIEAEPRRTGLAGMWDRATGRGMGSLASDISVFEKQAKGNIKEKVPPMEAMRRYIDVQMHEVGATRIRRAWLQQMAGRHVTDFKGGRRLVAKKLGPGERGIPVTVRENGKDVTYHVGDPRIARALQFNPHVVAGMGMNTMRKWFQQGTTGYFNPLFAPVSLAYDAFAGMLGGRTGRVVTGLMDDALARVGMSPQMRDIMAVLRPLDTLTVLGEGLYQGATGRIKEEYAIHMARRAAASGMPIDKAAAEAAASRFIDSKYGAMQMQGYSANMMTEGLTELDAGWLEKMSNSIVDAAKRPMLLRAYVSVLDGIRDAYRLGMFSRNVAHQQWLNKQNGKPVKLTQAQYRKIVNHVREVSVDPTKRGSNDFMNKVLSTMPYGNITLHSAAHMVRNIMTNPGAWWSMGSLITTTWALREMMSPEAQEYLDKRVPDYRRATSMSFEIPRAEGEPFDPQKHIRHLPIGPEPGLIVHGVLDGLHAWLTETETGDPAFAARIRSALFDMAIPGLPPVVNAAAAAFGQGPINTESALRGDSLFRQAQIEQGVPELRGVGMNDGAITDRVYYMVSSVLGSFGRTIMDAAEVLDSEMQQPDANFREGVEQVFDVVKFNTVDRQRFGSLFGNAVLQEARGTPMSDKAYRIRNFADEASQFARDLVPNFSEGPRDADIPYDEAMTIIGRGLNDPALQQQAMMIQKAFSGNPVIANAFRDISQLRTSYFRTQSNTRADISERNTVLNQINDEMHERYEVVASQYGMFEERMREMTGDPNWSLDTFLDAARKDIYSEVD